jgi:ATP-dependent DNA ligase
MREERSASRDTVLDIAGDVVSLGDASSQGEVVDRIPRGAEWRFEPDWDGLRVTARLAPGSANLVSDRGRDFDRYFPEVVRALLAVGIDDATVEGSLVVNGSQGLDFASVRRRLHPSWPHVESLAVSTPATLVLTDLVMRGADDLRRRSLAERRRGIEALAEEMGAAPAPTNLRRISPGEPLVLTPQTLDRAVARVWLVDRDATGRDGVIARHADGQRWVRVRHVRTAACVVTGYRRSGSGWPGSVRLGMFDGGTLVEVGRTVVFRRAPARRAAAAMIASVSTGAPAADAGTRWVDMPAALVCEVRYERLRGRRFRHAVTFVRWLPDRDPMSCTIDQLAH